MRSEGHVRDDLGTINDWLCLTRLRAAALVAAFGTAVGVAGGPIDLLVLYGVIATLGFFSLWALRWRTRGRSELPFFYAQHFVDLAAITIGIGAATSGGLALLFRPLFALVVIPASLVSIPSGLVVAAGATVGHELLLGLERGFSVATATSLESLIPSFLFFIVAQQCFFYGDHLERKNAELARLAGSLEDSRRGLADLVGIARVLNSTIESPEVLARVNGIARSRLAASWSATLLVDGSRGTLRVAAAEHADGRGSEVASMDVPMAAWPAIGRLSEERRILLLDREAAAIPDVLTDGRSFRCVLLAGLFRDNILIGALAVGHTGVPESTDPQTALARLVDIAEHATIALGNAQLLEEAREASALKSEFVSTMSHELRTPLNVILGYTEILRDADGATPSEVVTLLDRIETSSRDLLDLVDATLQVGRLEAGAIRVQRELVRIGDLLDSFDAATAGLPHCPEVGLFWDCPLDRTSCTHTDRAKAALIVRNLVNNAFKFTERGAVRVAVRNVGGTLSIEVRDTGIGIPDEKLPVIFGMFRQVDTPSSSGPTGVGLGLYIVDQLVRRLGGRIEVESRVGFGTSFTVFLPGYQEVESLTYRSTASPPG